MGHLLKIWARAICRRALIILVAAVLVTAFAATQVMKIKISTNIEALMPEGEGFQLSGSPSADKAFRKFLHVGGKSVRYPAMILMSGCSLQ